MPSATFPDRPSLTAALGARRAFSGLTPETAVGGSSLPLIGGLFGGAARRTSETELYLFVPRSGLAMGLGLGLVIATGLSVWVTAIRVAAGSGPFDRLDITYPMLVGTYYAGGLGGGLVIGLAWPLRRWLLGSALLGILGIFPIYLGATLMESAQSHWPTQENVLDAAVLAILVGAPLGTWLWFRNHPIRSPWVEALSSPGPKTIVVAWAMALLLSGGSCVLLPRTMENWPFGIVMLVFLAVFVAPIAVALVLTFRVERGSRR